MVSYGMVNGIVQLGMELLYNLAPRHPTTRSQPAHHPTGRSWRKQAMFIDFSIFDNHDDIKSY